MGSASVVGCWWVEGSAPVGASVLKCDLEGALEAQGDCRGGIRTVLTKLEVYYSPAEEELRLGVFFRPLQGDINLTKL